MWRAVVKKTSRIVFALGVAVVSLAAGATEQSTAPHHRHHKHHQAPQVIELQSPASIAPALEPTGAVVRPYAHPGDGDDDGLSRDPDDCNKGCIDGNPG